MHHHCHIVLQKVPTQLASSSKDEDTMSTWYCVAVNILQLSYCTKWVLSVDSLYYCSVLHAYWNQSCMNGTAFITVIFVCISCWWIRRCRSIPKRSTNSVNHSPAWLDNQNSGFCTIQHSSALSIQCQWYTPHSEQSHRNTRSLQLQTSVVHVHNRGCGVGSNIGDSGAAGRHVCLVWASLSQQERTDKETKDSSWSTEDRSWWVMQCLRSTPQWTHCIFITTTISCTHCLIIWTKMHPGHGYWLGKISCWHSMPQFV